MNITKIPVTYSKSALSHLTLAMFGQLSNRITCLTSTEMKGKIALITGSTGGIGKETARGLLERGIRVILKIFLRFLMKFKMNQLMIDSNVF